MTETHQYFKLDGRSAAAARAYLERKKAIESASDRLAQTVGPHTATVFDKNGYAVGVRLFSNTLPPADWVRADAKIPEFEGNVVVPNLATEKGRALREIMNQTEKKSLQDYPDMGTAIAPIVVEESPMGEKRAFKTWPLLLQHKTTGDFFMMLPIGYKKGPSPLDAKRLSLDVFETIWPSLQPVGVQNRETTCIPDDYQNPYAHLTGPWAKQPSKHPTPSHRPHGLTLTLK